MGYQRWHASSSICSDPVLARANIRREHIVYRQDKKATTKHRDNSPDLGALPGSVILRRAVKGFVRLLILPVVLSIAFFLIANATDIQIPAALQPVVKGIVRLHSDPRVSSAYPTNRDETGQGE